MPRNDNGGYVIKRHPSLLLTVSMDHQKAAHEGQVTFILRNVENAANHGLRP